MQRRVARPVWRGLGGNVRCNAQRAALPPYATHLLEAGVSLRLISGVSGTRLSGYHHHLHASHSSSGSADSGGDKQAGGSPVGIELAEIMRQCGPAYRQKFAGHLPIQHLQAMQAIETCRTEALGGQVQYSYHSCRNRHFPSARTRMPRPGLNNSRRCCCRCPTSYSPSPCQLGCGN